MLLDLKGVNSCREIWIVKKIKVYRVLGWIFFAYGIIGYLAYLLRKGLESGIVVSYSAIFGILTIFVFNVFLWVGLVFLWRADKNENSDKKSVWLRLIKIYIIFSLIVVMTAVTLPILQGVL